MLEPDLRFFASDIDVENQQYYISRASYSLPSHYFRDLQDVQYEGRVDFTKPVFQNRSKGNKVKFGGFYSTKNRTLSEVAFNIDNKDGVRYAGDIDAYFANENLGVIGETESGQNKIGLNLVNQTRLRNQYTGNQTVAAAYAMFMYDITPALKFIGGARYETTDLSVETGDTAIAKGLVKTGDILPSLNLVYSINEKSNLRFAATKTIARPNMREIAPFTTFQFIGGAIEVGNPNLRRSTIYNVDLRYEFFPNPGEIVALSAYSKFFNDPIVKGINPFASNLEILYQNVEKGQVTGLELEYRKDLGLVSDALKGFKFGANASYILSSSSLDPADLKLRQEFNPEAKNTRAFQGQSPYIVNGYLSYAVEKRKLELMLAVNTYGDRMYAIGAKQNPDIYEKGLTMLDFQVSKGFKSGITVKASAKNILNQAYVQYMEFNNQQFDLVNYKRGQDFGLSVNYTF